MILRQDLLLDFLKIVDHSFQVGLQFLPKKNLLRISLDHARIWNLIGDSPAKKSVSNCSLGLKYKLYFVCAEISF